MKNTGMIRSLDTLYRIVIPKEIRITMNLEVGDPIEFLWNDEGNFIALQRYVGTSCKLCDAIEHLTYFKGKLLCANCITELKGNIGVTTIPVPKIKEPRQKRKRLYHSTEDLIEKLRKLVQEHPNAKQSEYGKWLGVSQGRISQLIKLL
ncbi:regulator (plasmid) [Paenibacillus sp. IHB B 3084]|uniref:Regulator n=1 Tax=Paenibacillus terrae TaxID=159743 RepID=A0A0D7WVJ6_9BACL|nr:MULTISPECIES: AbrB/MazE/SpoVT family DNA-binding domain-containing protein [Paenibacillus]ALP39386.1 regulator [Paenibacillus sp. IHB B 3084]KJD43014.1 regulator [Paenibacillus terrae]